MNSGQLFSGGTEDVGKNQAGSPRTPSVTVPLFQAPDFSAVAKPSENGRKVNSERQRISSSSGRRVPQEDQSGDNRSQIDTPTSRDEQKKKNAQKKPAPPSVEDKDSADDQIDSSVAKRRRRRRSRDSEDTRESRAQDQVLAVEGSTRLEAKRQRRREGRREGRRKQPVTEAEFLARRESVNRIMVVRERDGLNQIAVLEDGLLVEHYVARHSQTSKVGNVYLGKIQNVLPSMEAAFIDIGEGRNGVLYAGEVNWDAVDGSGKQRKIEKALSSGDSVLVQVTKDPIGHKGARLTSQITLAGRYLVLVPSGSMTGISRKLPEKERARLKRVLKAVVPKGFGVIVRTAAEGASQNQLADDVSRLVGQWEEIQKKQKTKKSAPYLVRSEPELAVRVVRDIFNEDFSELIVSGESAWETISGYVQQLAPELANRLTRYADSDDVFARYRIDEQLAKGMDRKAWLPSGGSLVIDRTEAMTVIDVNTGRFTGAGGTLEETVTKNNLEAAEEIVRQLRLRDIGGIVVIDFVDMVLESNRDLVLRRLVECLGRDRTRHQVTEVTALGLVQMTRKRVGQGLVEAFSTECDCCGGRGFIVHDEPIERERDDILDAFTSKADKRRRRITTRSSGPKESKRENPARDAIKHIAGARGSNQETKSVVDIARDTQGTASEEQQSASVGSEQSAEVKHAITTEGQQPATRRVSNRKGRRSASSDGVVTPSQRDEDDRSMASDEQVTTLAAGEAPIVRLAKPRKRRRAAQSSPMVSDSTGD